MKKTLFLPNNKTEDDMNIRIGDIVRFISDKLEGKVTGIIDNNTVNVYCDEYGFEIPASVNNLVVIHSDSNTTKMVSRPHPDRKTWSWNRPIPFTSRSSPKISTT